MKDVSPNATKFRRCHTVEADCPSNASSLWTPQTNVFVVLHKSISSLFLPFCFSSKTEEIRYFISQHIQKQVSGIVDNPDHITSSNTSEYIFQEIFSFSAKICI